jgi:predicted Zn-dependent protease
MNRKALFALSASVLAVGFAGKGLAQRSGSDSYAQQHAAAVAEFGGELGGPTGAYVASVGQRVAAQAGGGSYRITTLNSPVNNAFASPGGYVYMTRQLLGLMDDEAELAFVLGHEVGHLAANHPRERQSAVQRNTILGALGQLFARSVAGSSGIGEILTRAIGTGTTALTSSFTQRQEFESDDLGVAYLARAGYDPTASATLLTSLGQATSLEARAAGRSDQRSTPSWARTHPLSQDRVRRASQRAQQTGTAGRGLRNRDQFLARIDGLIVDDDPRQGVIDGREFLHPDLRLAFTAPQGFGMQNGVRAVTVAGSSGQALFSTGSFNGNLGTYIGQVYQGLAGQQAGQLQIPQPRTTTVNGIPAAYTTARVNTQQGQVDLSVFAYQFDTNRAYHFATITQAGAGLGPFSSMVGSVRRLSASESAAIRPRVIDVVTVRAGDTVQSLSNRMAYNDLKLDRFLTLNSLAANSPLRPGDKVKLVVYGTRT